MATPENGNPCFDALYAMDACADLLRKQIEADVEMLRHREALLAKMELAIDAMIFHMTPEELVDYKIEKVIRA